jgi:GAF domain-containing protein
MADQVAVAIDNALLFSQTQTALEELQAVQRRYVTEAWGRFLSAHRTTQIGYVKPGAESRDESLLREARRAALVHGRTVATTSALREADSPAGTCQAALVVPLKLRGQVIGTVALHKTTQGQEWSAEETALAETVVEQAALTVENLRLMDETRRRAARERLVSEIAGQIWASLDPDTILKTTVRELGRALRAQAATIEIGGPSSDNGGSPVVEYVNREEE